MRKLLEEIEDDTEEAPWMVMGSPQSDALTVFFPGLQAELRSRTPPLFAAQMLPILYRLGPGSRVEQLAPDVLVATVPIRARSSYRLDRERVPPGFVLEIVSPESQSRDVYTKRERYAAIGIPEYALFAPETAEGQRLLEPALQGFRLDPETEEYVRWEPDAAGRLYSDVLHLWLAVREGELRAQRLDSSWLPTVQEETAARQEAERAREEAERAREAETQARAAAEREITDLQAELEKYRREQT